MTPALIWITRFAEFALDRGVPALVELVESFVEENPELRDPPPEPAQGQIDARIDAAIKDKFG